MLIVGSVLDIELVEALDLWGKEKMSGVRRGKFSDEAQKSFIREVNQSQKRVRSRAARTREVESR